MYNEVILDDEAHVSERRAQSEDAGRSLPVPRRRGLASAAIHIARSRWSLAANVIVATSRAAHMVDQDQRDFRRETQDALGQVLRGELHVALVVDKPQDLAAINYCQQGDSRLYCEDALRRRAGNRTDPGLLEAVRDWWRWLPKAQTSLVAILTTAATPPPPPVTPAVDDATALLPPSPSPCMGGEADVETGGGPTVAESEQEKAVGVADIGAGPTDTEGVKEAEGTGATDAGVASPGHEAVVLAEEAGLGFSEEVREGRVAVAEGPSGRQELGEAEDVQQDRSCRTQLGNRGGGVVVVIGGGSGGGGGTLSGARESLASALPSEDGTLVAGAQAAIDGSSSGDAASGDVGDGADSCGGGGNLVDWAVLQVAVVDEPIYSAMVVAITLVLLPRFGIRADPEYDPSQDWLDDNEGLPHMDFKHFFDAMFDLADLWSTGVEAAQYVDLLVTLLQDVQQLETTQAAFSLLLQKFRAVKQPPTQQPPPLQQQQETEQPSQPPHPFQLQQQPVQHKQQQLPPSRNMLGHGSEAKAGGFHPDLKPDPRLPPQSTVATGAAGMTPVHAVAAAAAAVAPPPWQRGVAHQSHPPGPHPAMLAAAMNVATPVTVAFPTRLAAAAAWPPPPGSHRTAGSTSRGPSPAPSAEVGYGRRDATFKLPQYNRLDVSGVRSPLADYLRSGVPRPDQAQLEEWRRRRTGSSRRTVRGGGHERFFSAQRNRSPSAVALSAELLNWPHSPGSREGSDGAVLMYEEYMHAMASRYLAQQQKVLVATSAGAAAAAGQLLAAAAASARAAWEGNTESNAAAPEVAPEPARATAVTRGLDRSTVAASIPPGAKQTHHHHHHRRQHGEQHQKQQYQHQQPHNQQHLQQQQQQQEQRQQRIEEEKQQQQLSAPATAAAAMDTPAPDINQKHEDSLDPTLGLASTTDAERTLAPSSAFMTTEAVNAAAAAVEVGGAASASPHSSAPPGSVVVSSTSPRGPAAALTDWSQPSPLIPPPLPPLSAPTIDPQLIAFPQPVCVVGHAVTVEAPPPLPAAPGFGSGNGSPGSGGARPSRTPFRRQSRPYSSHAAPAAISASAPASDSLAENAAAARTMKGQAAAMAASSAPQSASGAVDQDGTGGYGDAEAQAQAQVVVTFAAAAYRLADPNVHSLLLPTRLTPSSRDGSLVVQSLSLSNSSQGGLSPGRVFSGRAGGSSPTYSPSSQRAWPQTVSPSAATANNPSQPYLSAALSCMVPHFASEMSGGARPAGEGTAGVGCGGGGGRGTAAPWTQSATSPVGERPGPSPPAVTVSPPGTPLLTGSRRPSTALAVSAPTSVSAIAAAAAAAAAAANSIGGAVARRLASASLSRTAPPHQPASPASRTMGPQPPGAAIGNEIATIHGPHQQPHQQVTDSTDFYPTYHVQNRHQLPNQCQNQDAPTAPHSPGGGAGTGSSGSGGSHLMNRWALTPQSCSTGLVQTPRSSLRPGAAISSAGPGPPHGATTAAANGSGGGRHFSAATGLYNSSSGGSASGGVGLSAAGTSSRLRPSYSSPMMLATMLGDMATAGTAANNSRRGSRSSGHGDEAVAAGTGRPIPLMAGDGPSSSDATNIGGFHIFPSAALQSARRRSHTHESNATASTAAAGPTSDSAYVVRSPVRIRSSDPVGLADAVTAARMNVAIMADELLQRQAEQRAQARRLREQTLHLRPSTAAARQSFPNAFGAFLAAREATGLAWGSVSGAMAKGTGGQGSVQRAEEAQPPLA